MKGLKCQVEKVGCWGLPFLVLLCIVHGTITSAATIPTSALPPPNGPIPPPLPSQMSNIKKRNANFHQQIAMIRNNATVAAVQPQPIAIHHSPSPVPLPPPLFGTTPQQNISVPVSVAPPSSAPSSINNASLNSSSSIFTSSLNANNFTLKNHSLQQSVAATTTNRIGQVLLDSSVSLNDITVCGSEDCFDTGMQITTDSVPPPTPTMRQHIADAILLSDFRNKGRGERFSYNQKT